MSDEPDHSGPVDAWLTRCPPGLAAPALLRLFQAALDALWSRAKVPLGEVTLTAIADRVLYNAAETFPVFSSLKIGSSGELEWQAFLAPAATTPPAELTVGMKFVLVEFLTVIGNLTAEILTPPLHAELEKLSVDDTKEAT